MSCEICGRYTCMKSFHSAEEQLTYEDIADPIKERTIKLCENELSSVEVHWVEINGQEVAVYLCDEADKAVREAW